MHSKKMRITLLILCIALGEIANAQPNTWLWAQIAEGKGYKEAKSISTDLSGNIYITGYFMDTLIIFGSDTLYNSNPANGDIFLVKYDPLGNVLWARAAGGSSLDIAFSVATDKSGNAVVAGFFVSPSISFGASVLTNTNTQADIFMVKYDPNGNVLWAKSAGGTSYDEAYTVATDTAGNIFLAGYFQSPSITFGSFTLTGSYDVFIVKYNSAGTVIWAKSAGGSKDEEASSITTDVAGNCYIAGYFHSPGITFGSTTLPNSNGGYKVFVAKYDKNGNALWAQSATGEAGASKVTTDVSGNIVITGTFTSQTVSFDSYTLTNGTGTAQEKDVFVVKYNNTGNVVWAKSVFGDTGDEEALSIATDNLGNIFVVGWFDSIHILFGSNSLTNAGMGAHMFMVQYDVNGNDTWAFQPGGNGTSGASGVAVDKSNNAIVTGAFGSGYIDFDSYGLINTNASERDLFVIKRGIALGMENSEIKNDISIFPNPFYAQTTLGVTLFLKNATLTVYNSWGQLVKQVNNISGQSIILQRDNLPGGLYFIRLMQADDLIATDKLVIAD